MTARKKAPAKARAKREKMPWDDLPRRFENSDYKQVAHRENPRVTEKLAWVKANRVGVFQPPTYVIRDKALEIGLDSLIRKIKQEQRSK